MIRHGRTSVTHHADTHTHTHRERGRKWERDKNHSTSADELVDPHAHQPPCRTTTLPNQQPTYWFSKERNGEAKQPATSKTARNKAKSKIATLLMIPRSKTFSAHAVMGPSLNGHPLGWSHSGLPKGEPSFGIVLKEKPQGKQSPWLQLALEKPKAKPKGSLPNEFNVVYSLQVYPSLHNPSQLGLRRTARVDTFTGEPCQFGYTAAI